MSATLTKQVRWLVLPVAVILAFGTWYLFDPGFSGNGKVVETDPTQGEFGQRVRDYLIQNPEVLVEAMQVLEDRRSAEEQNEAQAAIAQHRDELLFSQYSPVVGNPQGEVTLVEFFDYNCPYCRQVAPVMSEAMTAEPDLRIVYKEFPILGPNSVFAAKAALAAARQEAYKEFHEAMMALSGSADQSEVLAVAEKLQLDVEKLQADMQSPEIQAEIDRNLKLASALRINGTPGFVIGGEIVRGATDLETMKSLIAKARDDDQPVR
jgi:protein-disulfide isomerase